MTLIVRDALLEELNDVADLNVKAFHDYSHALTVENWNIMRTNLSNPAEVIQNGQLIVAEQDHQILQWTG
ncbi:MAG: hypothetical protein KME47_04560 [Nodosilinea sp. WJT8-NPBG4]|jgi:hypothetical protein|nr:hypothetical protein [Nodosilinea sp. WJT8-NPBG4]